MNQIPGNTGPLYEEGDDEDFGPLSEETRQALEAIGITQSDWQPEILTQGDAEHVLAFHKFLSNGEWSTTEEGEKIYVVDQPTFDYATGKITSKEYLDAAEGVKNVPEP